MVTYSFPIVYNQVNVRLYISIKIEGVGKKRKENGGGERKGGELVKKPRYEGI